MYIRYGNRIGSARRRDNGNAQCDLRRRHHQHQHRLGRGRIHRQADDHRDRDRRRIGHGRLGQQGQFWFLSNFHFFVSAIGSGCDILLEDIDDGLAMIPDNSFDVAVLSETLQTIKRPRELLHQILRVAREAVITFPNFACLEVRTRLLFSGRMPKGKQIPFEWYNTPNIHLFTLLDFLALCREDNIRILDLIGQGRGLTERLLLTLGMKNLGASSVIVRIARGD